MHTKPSNFFLLDIKKTSGILGEKKVKLELEGLNIKHKEALWITAVAQGPSLFFCSGILLLAKDVETSTLASACKR